VNVHALLATGVNAADCREILGLHVTTSEDGADWLAFFRDRERGAHREAELADAEAGLTRAPDWHAPAADTGASTKGPAGISSA
jgi:transposase-like protein